MKRMIITGGNKLSGTINIGGAKNSAVALLPAAILGGVSTIKNVHWQRKYRYNQVFIR